MKIYAMMFDNTIKFIGLDKAAVQKCVDHQVAVYRKGYSKVYPDGTPKVWLAEMEPIPTPVPVSQPRDSKGRFIKR